MQRKQIAAINITPLVDVLLILLVILMLAMPMYVKRLPVSLPVTSLSGTPTVVKALSVSINKEGQFLVNGLYYPLADMQKKIDAETSLDLSIDKDVPYSTIAQVISSLQEKSPKEINLVTN
jgi:biopolymer transport protein ExbD